MILLLGVHRACYLLPAMAGVLPAVAGRGLSAVLLTATALWGMALLTWAARGGRLTAQLAGIDLAATGALLLASGLRPDLGLADLQWIAGLTQSSALLLAFTVAPLRLTVAALVTLIGGQAAVALRAGLGPDDLVYLLNPVIVCAALGYAVRQLTPVGGLARSGWAVEAGRPAIPSEYGRALHDTVLTTLTAIARGGLDHRGPQIRSQCARDADYLRRLLTDDLAAGPDSLADVLRQTVDAGEALGLRVHYRHGSLPAGVAPKVLAGLRASAREAVNNVFKHADVLEFWITAGWVTDRLRITVVDHGRGFDPGRDSPGSGIQRSITERMASIGGQARITSEPGGGTCVELTWPR